MIVKAYIRYMANILNHFNVVTEREYWDIYYTPVPVSIYALGVVICCFIAENVALYILRLNLLASSLVMRFNRGFQPKIPGIYEHS